MFGVLWGVGEVVREFFGVWVWFVGVGMLLVMLFDWGEVWDG